MVLKRHSIGPRLLLELAILVSLALVLSTLPAAAEDMGLEQIIISEETLGSVLEAEAGATPAAIHDALGDLLPLDEESASRIASNAPQPRPDTGLRLIGAVAGQGVVVDMARGPNGQETSVHLVQDPAGRGRVQPRWLNLTTTIRSDGVTGVLQQGDGAVLQSHNVALDDVSTESSAGTAITCYDYGNAACDLLQGVAMIFWGFMVAGCAAFLSAGPPGALVAAICVVAVSAAVYGGILLCNEAVETFCARYYSGNQAALDLVRKYGVPLEPCDIECPPGSQFSSGARK